MIQRKWRSVRTAKKLETRVPCRLPSGPLIQSKLSLMGTLMASFWPSKIQRRNESEKERKAVKGQRRNGKEKRHVCRDKVFSACLNSQKRELIVSLNKFSFDARFFLIDVRIIEKTKSVVIKERRARVLKGKEEKQFGPLFFWPLFFWPCFSRILSKDQTSGFKGYYIVNCIRIVQVHII